MTFDAFAKGLIDRLDNRCPIDGDRLRITT